MVTDPLKTAATADATKVASFFETNPRATAIGVAVAVFLLCQVAAHAGLHF